MYGAGVSRHKAGRESSLGSRSIDPASCKPPGGGLPQTLSTSHLEPTFTRPAFFVGFLPYVHWCHCYLPSFSDQKGHIAHDSYLSLILLFITVILPLSPLQYTHLCCCPEQATIISPWPHNHSQASPPACFCPLPTYRFTSLWPESYFKNTFQT